MTDYERDRLRAAQRRAARRVIIARLKNEARLQQQVYHLRAELAALKKDRKPVIIINGE